MLIDGVEHTIATMRRLRSLGVHFSLDDFGTGYSCLNYLKRLPFSRSRSINHFTRDVLSDANDAAICRAIIAPATARAERDRRRRRNRRPMGAAPSTGLPLCPRLPDRPSDAASRVRNPAGRTPAMSPPAANRIQPGLQAAARQCQRACSPMPARLRQDGRSGGFSGKARADGQHNNSAVFPDSFAMRLSLLTLLLATLPVRCWRMRRLSSALAMLLPPTPRKARPQTIFANW